MWISLAVVVVLVTVHAVTCDTRQQCPQLQFPVRPMGAPFTDLVCNTYQSWCDNMKLRHFRPTERQSAWWKSLGADQFYKQLKGDGDRKENSRRKRDTGDDVTRMERKEYRMLSDEERKRFHLAVRELKVKCSSIYITYLYLRVYI